MHILGSFEMFLRIQIISSKVKKLVAKRLIEAIVRRCFVKKVFLEILQNSQKNIKKESLAQVFSCGFCEMSKNTFFTEHFGWLKYFSFV